MQRYPSINADANTGPPPVGEHIEYDKAPDYDYVSGETSEPAQKTYSPPPQPPPQARQTYTAPPPPNMPAPQQQHYPPTYAPPPMQPQTGVYMASVPLQSLNMGPAPVDCPLCGTRTLTKINYEAGNQTQSVPLPLKNIPVY